MGQPVALVPLTEENWRAALEVRVTDDQLPQVADHQPVALIILAKAQVGAGGGMWEPLAISADDSIVGVVGITHRAKHSFMENLAIDHRSQRQGFGRAAVLLTLAHCERRGSTELLLTVHDNNLAAQQLYRETGFEPTGRRPFGDPEWVHRFGEASATDD